ncbi:MAG: trypsin-like peptidase domain-containing protein [Myxococcota bacterium]|nr:trypsin-like peptidase domain-containing protein [Myxococcota bacterium]
MRGVAVIWVFFFMASSALAQDPFLRRTATVAVVEEAGPAVVSITTEKILEGTDAFGRQARNPQRRRYFSDLFEPDRSDSKSSLGSGVIISNSGLILTNEHVVSQASRIEIRLADGRSFSAQVIGADPTNDIAVLKAETDEVLPWLLPGESSDIMVGEPVIAIGNPFGLSNTVTTGVVSAIDRSVVAPERKFHGFIQTDASINAGNSGGPLLNAEGSLIGINTAIYGNSEGIAFAIPIDAAKRVMRELIEHGEVPPVTLGLEFQALDPALSEVIGLPRSVGGALVSRVHPGGSAASAQLRRGDVLAEFDGRRIKDARQLYEILQTMTPDQTVELTIWRDGEFQNIELVARKIPENVASQLAHRLLGVDLQWDDQGYFSVSRVRNGSPAHMRSIRKGDILLAVNGLALTSKDSLKRAMLSLRGRDRALVMVQRGAGRRPLSIPLH